jgi:hypothetical protein
MAGLPALRFPAITILTNEKKMVTQGRIMYCYLRSQKRKELAKLELNILISCIVKITMLSTRAT